MAVSGNINRIFIRKFSQAAPSQKQHDAARMWKRIYFFVGLPALALSGLNCYLNGHHPDPPEFIPYEHMRIRNKPFPWGDGVRTFFHNPRMNALPTGYEDH